MKMHNIICCILSLHGLMIYSSQSFELTRINSQASYIQPTMYQRALDSQNSAAFLHQISSMHDPYRNFSDFSLIERPDERNLNNHEHQNIAHFNQQSDNVYSINMNDERRPRPKFSVKTSISLAAAGSLSLFKVIVDIMQLQKYYEFHPSNEGPGLLIFALVNDTICLSLIAAVLKFNESKLQ